MSPKVIQTTTRQSHNFVMSGYMMILIHILRHIQVHQSIPAQKVDILATLTLSKRKCIMENGVYSQRNA